MPCMNNSPRRNPPGPPNRQARPRSSAGRLFVLAFFLLAGLLATTLFGRLLLERRIARGPTPTIIQQAASHTDTPTVDFRATQNIDDIITQNAYRAVLTGITTPARDVTATPIPTETPIETPVVELPTNTPAQLSIFVPGLIGSNPGGIPSTETTPTASGINLQTPTSPPDAATQTAIAGATATALLLTPTLTSTPLSTDTPSPTPSNTAVPTVTPTQPIVVTILQAQTKDPAKVYAGPGVLYSFIREFPVGFTVRVIGRTISGEWVRVCCVDNIDGWTRQAFLTINDNNVPSGATPNPSVDYASRLVIEQTTAALLAPQPNPTGIARSSFPLYRRDAAGTGRVDADFRPPFIKDDLFSSQARADFSSPPVISGSIVIAASNDSQLYSFAKDQGNQRWRIPLPEKDVPNPAPVIVQFTPAIQDPYIYVVDQKGEIIALRDTGNVSDAFFWRRKTGIAPSAPLNIDGDILYMAGSDHVLYAFNRLDGSPRWTFPAPQGTALQYPAIGDQMIYVGDGKLSALDVYSGTVIWQDPVISSLAGPPVYGRPGVNRLAEVYAVDENGVVHALDANTGAQLWRKGTSDRPTFLALDEMTLYAAGPDFVSVRDRRTGDETRRIDVSNFSIQKGGPLVGDNRTLLVAGSSGSVRILDAASGQTVAEVSITSGLIGSPAVSDGEIFLTGNDSRLYKIKSAP